jgi:16S rRNA processing protein RimM
MINDAQWLEIGKIVAPQGLKGEVRVYPSSDFPERFIKAGRRWLQNPQTQEIREIFLERGRYLEGKNLYILKLQSIDDRDLAEALKDYKLLVPETDRPHLSEDEYHVADLIGLAVYHQVTGELIGTTIDVYSLGNDLLQVELAPQPDAEIIIGSIESITKTRPKKTVFIPFVKAIVPLVDLKRKRIEIDPPSGLLEI